MDYRPVASLASAFDTDPHRNSVVASSWHQTLDLTLRWCPQPPLRSAGPRSGRAVHAGPLVGRLDFGSPDQDVPVIEPVELGPVKTKGDAFVVASTVGIEPDVTPANTLVIRTGHAAALLAFGLVLIT